MEHRTFRSSQRAAEDRPSLSLAGCFHFRLYAGTGDGLGWLGQLLRRARVTSSLVPTSRRAQRRRGIPYRKLNHERER
jgi:hypothetical protein